METAQILTVGLNHKTAPIEVREKVALATGQLSTAMFSLFEYVPQGIILSTCNRTEVYALADARCSEKGIVETFLSSLGDMPIDQLSPYLYSLQQEKAVTHLFRVAAGLESMVVGEYEILGQVRQALETAEQTGIVHLPLLNLFRQAVRVGRRAREETAISRSPVSVSSAAADLARKMFPDLGTRKALVIAAGEAGQLAVKALVQSMVGEVLITSRSFEKAAELASSLGGTAVSIHRLEATIAEADIVISCSGSPHYIIHAPLIAEVMAERPQRPLLLIDIGVPRNIDPAVKSIGGAHLYDIDDLEEICESNHLQRRAEVTKVEAIISDEASRFLAWWHSLETVPTITALVNRAEKIRRAQQAKTLDKLAGLSEEDRARIDAMTQSIVRQLLHNPILYLKDGKQNRNLVQAIREIFGLDNEESV